MPRPHPPEFRRRAVELARERAKPVSAIAKDLGISDSCLRHWMVLADVAEGRSEGVNPAGGVTAARSGTAWRSLPMTWSTGSSTSKRRTSCG